MLTAAGGTGKQPLGAEVGARKAMVINMSAIVCYANASAGTQAVNNSVAARFRRKHHAHARSGHHRDKQLEHHRDAQFGQGMHNSSNIGMCNLGTMAC